MHQIESQRCESPVIATTGAMAILGVSRATVTRMARDGRLTALLASRSGYVFDRAEVVRLALSLAQKRTAA